MKNEYRDWNDFSQKLENLVRQFKIVDSVPDLSASSDGALVTKLYITRGNKIYFYTWTVNDLSKSSIEDTHFLFDNCFLEDVDICSAYIRLIK